jgi:endo-beta-N-acetylglucosaminidase D
MRVKYLVKYDFNVAENGGRIVGKSGEIDINTDMPINIIKGSVDLKNRIKLDMEDQLNKHVLMVEITEVLEVK